jgi:hypothetical protein
MVSECSPSSRPEVSGAGDAVSGPQSEQLGLTIFEDAARGLLSAG